MNDAQLNKCSASELAKVVQKMAEEADSNLTFKPKSKSKAMVAHSKLRTGDSYCRMHMSDRPLLHKFKVSEQHTAAQGGGERRAQAHGAGQVEAAPPPLLVRGPPAEVRAARRPRLSAGEAQAAAQV